MMLKFEEEEPIFGLIDSIILHNSIEPYIVTEILETVGYNVHLPFISSFSPPLQNIFSLSPAFSIASGL